MEFRPPGRAEWQNGGSFVVTWTYEHSIPVSTINSTVGVAATTPFVESGVTSAYVCERLHRWQPCRSSAAIRRVCSTPLRWRCWPRASRILNKSQHHSSVPTATPRCRRGDDGALEVQGETWARIAAPARMSGDPYGALGGACFGTSPGKKIAAALRSTVTTCPGGMSVPGSSAYPRAGCPSLGRASRIPSRKVLPSLEKTCPRAVSSGTKGRDRSSSRDRPRRGISGMVEREGIGEGSGRFVSGGERLAQIPPVAQGGDQGGVAMLLVEHVPLGHPGRDQDGGDPVAGAVECEPELAGRSGRIRRGNSGWWHVVVGASR